MTDSTPERYYFETRELCHRDVYRHLSILRRSLQELKLMSKKAFIENTLFWQQEVEKAKQEKDRQWLDKVNQTEEENRQLKKQIEMLTAPNTFTIETENEMDQLNRQLDLRLIHINRLQNAYAEQSKAMFELEKSYVLLRYEYLRTLQNEAIRSRKTSGL